MKITIENTLHADVKKVWEMYNNPVHITHWNFASDDWHCPRAENNFAIGGKYIARMEAKDGSFGFEFTATYDEIIPFEKIVYILDDGRVVETIFTNQGDTTHVTTTFDGEKQNPLEMQKAGWQAILDNFKKYVEKN